MDKTKARLLNSPLADILPFEFSRLIVPFSDLHRPPPHWGKTINCVLCFVASVLTFIAIKSNRCRQVMLAHTKRNAYRKGFSRPKDIETRRWQMPTAYICHRQFSFLEANVPVSVHKTSFGKCALTGRWHLQRLHQASLKP